MNPAKPDVWNDLENNHVTYGDRVRIAAYGRALESQLKVAVAALEWCAQPCRSYPEPCTCIPHKALAAIRAGRDKP